MPGGRLPLWDWRQGFLLAPGHPADPADPAAGGLCLFVPLAPDAPSHRTTARRISWPVSRRRSDGRPYSEEATKSTRATRYWRASDSCAATGETTVPGFALSSVRT